MSIATRLIDAFEYASFVTIPALLAVRFITMGEGKRRG